jgi:hypothetical protein
MVKIDIKNGCLTPAPSDRLGGGLRRLFARKVIFSHRISPIPAAIEPIRWSLDKSYQK